MAEPEWQVATVTMEGGRKEPRIRWKDGYAVISFNEVNQEYPLPGREKLIRQEDTLRQRNVLVFGERSGGVRDFLEWWRGALGSEVPWIFAHGTEWAPHLLLRSDGVDAMQQEARQDGRLGPLDAVLQLGKDLSAAEKAEILVGWAGQLTAPFALFIRDFPGTGDKAAESSAQAFRIIRDVEKCPHLHLVIGTGTASNFSDHAFRSGYMAVAHCYRLGSLTRAQIHAILEWYAEQQGRPLQISDAGLDKLGDTTGGQPMLVQAFAQRIVESFPGAVGEKEVRRVAQQMNQSPPRVTEHWQDELREILRAKSELVPAMARYVQDSTLGPAKFPPPAQERPLMIAGWLKTNRLGRWGIASDLHAVLARQVLDAFQVRAKR